MSQASLLQFLEKLDVGIHQKSREYRAATADKLVHHFIFSVAGLVEETEKQLIKMNRTLESKDKNVIKDGAKVAGDELASVINGFTGRGMLHRLKYSVTGKIDFSFTTTTDTKLTPNKEKTEFVFGKIKDVYNSALNTYFITLQEHFTEKDKKAGIKEELRGLRGKDKPGKIGERFESHGQMWNAGHEHGTGIYESILRNAFSGAADATDVITETGASATEAEILQMLAAHDIDLGMMRDGATDDHTIFIESNNWNKVYGGKARKNQTQLFASVSNAIKKLKVAKDLGTLSGSDSPLEKFGKQTLNAATDPFRKQSNIKFKGKRQKIDTTTRRVTIPVGGKARRGKKQKYDAVSGGALLGIVAAKRNARAKSRSGISLQRLLPIINKQLPDVVAKRMKYPRLETRTGRLASSARVIDVQKTPGGFASFGYTYMRDPYEVYETSSGTRFADSDRDPRPLIASSIREIAAQHGVGKLYARRL